MNRDQDRYWLSLQQTVSRIVQELADGYDDEQVHAELAAHRCGRRTTEGVFARVHRVPDGTADVDDEPDRGLVIFGLDRPHSKKAKSVAAEAAQEFLASRGGQPASTRTRWSSSPRTSTGSTRSTRCCAARWRGSRSSKRVRELNLDQHNITVVERRLAQAKQAVADTIRETYKWIIVPYQEPGQPRSSSRRSL